MVRLYGLTSPCMDCEKREPGCACDAYKEYRAEYERRKNKARAERDREAQLTNYQVTQMQKVKKRGGRKTGRRK